MVVKIISMFLLVGATLPLAAPAFQFTSPTYILRTSTGERIRGVRDRAEKDFVLGGLFPIHAATNGGGACGEVQLERGLERMEAMLFAIDKINSDSSLLPGLTLGFDIRDTCSSENIGLDEAVDLVITSSQLDIISCPAAITSRDNGTAMEAPTMGIVGAAASQVSIPVATLVRLFTTPQVSYASSSALLSNRDRYEYFYRTIPPDNLQARAMIDVMLHFGWAYVSTIYSLNPYGEPGIAEFQALADEKGICIDLDVGISDSFTQQDFDALAQQVINSQANIVVLFTSQSNAMQLLRSITNTGTARRFVWIASDAWARSISVAQMFNTTTAGLYGFAPLTDHLSKFEDYFSQLTVNNNARNPWFGEFYEAIANCTLDDIEGGRDTCDRNSSVTEIPSYQQGNFIPLVVDAVYTYAQALQDFLDENCQEPLQWFPNNRTCFNQTRALNGATLLEYIQRVNFGSITGNRVLFDSEGNIEGRYEILNYQASDASGRREYNFERVATWDSSVSNDSNQQALSLEPSAVFQFGVRNQTDDILYTPPESQCQKCALGYIRRVLPSACCGLCEPCLGAEFSNDSDATNCSVCEGRTWGNDPLVGSERCVPIEESFLEASHPYSIIIMIVAIIGLVGVAFSMGVFAVFWKTPVVKSSGREQMVLLLIGIAISFVSAFFFVAPPGSVVCGFQRWLLWTGFCIMFSALLVKSTRVARIFLRKNVLSHPRFTEPGYQVLFTFILVLLQWLILVIAFAVQHPIVEREIRRNVDDPNQFPEVIVTCTRDHIAVLVLAVVYESALIVACTILGALSFSYPQNFNEAKYITFCSLTILVIWIACIITYIATRDMQEFQNIAVSLAIVMSGYAVLAALFGPKLVIVLFQPKKNVTHSSQQVGRDISSTTHFSSNHLGAVQTLAQTLPPKSPVPQGKCVMLAFQIE
jgi:metabotropic glutamate receptor 2/3/metabotropic glutamate receptor 6/7/8